MIVNSSNSHKPVYQPATDDWFPLFGGGVGLVIDIDNTGSSLHFQRSANLKQSCVCASKGEKWQFFIWKATKSILLLIDFQIEWWLFGKWHAMQQQNVYHVVCIFKKQFCLGYYQYSWNLWSPLVTGIPASNFNWNILYEPTYEPSTI